MRTGRVTIRLNRVLWVVLLVIAGGLRLARLSWPPLSNAEAGQAMAALESTPGSVEAWLGRLENPSSSPAYRTATHVLFQAFGSSEAAARAVPVLFGLGIVMLPLLLRRRVGEGVALAAGMLLALSPSLTGVSRLAGGEAVAAFGIAAAAAWIVGRRPEASPYPAWALLGLALAAGRSFYAGALTLGLGGGLFWLLTALWPELRQRKPVLGDFASGWWLLPLVAVGIATAMGFKPGWAHDLFGTASEWLAGWGRGGGIGILTELAILPLYDPLLLLLGIAGVVIVVRKREILGVGAGCWTLAGLVMAIVYPSRQPQDVMWILLPLSILAGRALTALIDLPDRAESRAERVGLGLGFLVMMGYLYLQLAAWADLAAGGDPQALALRLGVSAIVLGAVLLATVILGYLWLWEEVWGTLARAGVVLLFLLTISASWRISLGPGAVGAGGFWRAQGSTVGLGQLQQTIESLSLLETGRPDLLAFDVVGEPPPALAWALRSMQRVRLGKGLAEEYRNVVLAPEFPAIFVADEGYMGQSLSIGEQWGWEGAKPLEIGRWWFKGHLPALSDRWTVWVRTDLIE